MNDFFYKKPLFRLALYILNNVAKYFWLQDILYLFVSMAKLEWTTQQVPP